MVKPQSLNFPFGIAGLGLFALVVSMANSLQARVNGAASVFTDDAVVAAMMSVGGGFIISFSFVMSRKSSRQSVFVLMRGFRSGGDPRWYYLAGVGGGVFILGHTLFVPTVGVTVYMIAIVAGQTIGSLIVDRFGLGPAGVRGVTRARIVASLVALLGVGLAAWGGGNLTSLTVAASFYGVGAGFATSAQYALNGSLASGSGSAMVTSALNFMLGFSFLTIILLVNTTFYGLSPAWPPAPWDHPFLWLGGPLGVLFISTATLFVRHLGILAFTLLTVTGQLLGAIILDVFFSATGVFPSAAVFLGLGLAALGGYISALKKYRG